MILIIEKENTKRLCKDGYFRDFAMFGSFKDCVKIYKTLGHAFHRAKEMSARVVNIPDHMKLEWSGTIIETVPCPDKEGYVQYFHPPITKFIVNNPLTSST
jgi:hypothetical protein